MSVIISTCPHCFKENVAFKSVGEYRLSLKIKELPEFPFLFNVSFVCGNCEGGLTAEVGMFAMEEAPSPHLYSSGLSFSDSYVVVNTYPKPSPIIFPDYLPDNVLKALSGAYICLRSHLPCSTKDTRPWDLAAMGCRKVLEISCKTLDPDFSGNLEKRINNLADQHIITRQLAEWAHAIRIDGNFAAHELDSVDESFAKELFNFTEIFLMYVFTLPGMLAARRAQKPG